MMMPSLRRIKREITSCTQIQSLLELACEGKREWAGARLLKSSVSVVVPPLYLEWSSNFAEEQTLQVRYSYMVMNVMGNVVYAVDHPFHVLATKWDLVDREHPNTRLAEREGREAAARLILQRYTARKVLHAASHCQCLLPSIPVNVKAAATTFLSSHAPPNIPGSAVSEDGLSDEGENEEGVESIAGSSNQGDRLAMSQLAGEEEGEDGGGEEEVFPSFHKPTDHELWMGTVHVDMNFEARRLADGDTIRRDPEDPYRWCDDEDMRNIRAGILNFKVNYQKLAAWEAKHGPYVWPPYIEYRDASGRWVKK
eukprot:jgi/Mesvir1/6551/Mv16811-RA.1